jgi:FlaA1/EpsC-like NDP-sugar epimerase
MISSDKAVQPSSVMGATKRIAEMLIQNRAISSCTTKFACVRFGNVVGSRGSVIPIFLKQIADGKAITITDERMSRFFMTIKEAVRLVLQASSLACRGEIYTLDMGEPLRITHLARKLTEMSGLQADTVPMETIGIRPGEKLHEQLWQEGLDISPTEFPGVYSVDSCEIPPDFEASVMQLEEIAIKRRDDLVLEKLRAMPIQYRQEPETADSQHSGFRS